MTDEQKARKRQSIEAFRDREEVKIEKWKEFVKEDYEGIQEYVDCTIFVQLMMDHVLVEYQKKGHCVIYKNTDGKKCTKRLNRERFSELMSEIFEDNNIATINPIAFHGRYHTIRNTVASQDRFCKTKLDGYEVDFTEMEDYTKVITPVTFTNHDDKLKKISAKSHNCSGEEAWKESCKVNFDGKKISYKCNKAEKQLIQDAYNQFEKKGRHVVYLDKNNKRCFTELTAREWSELQHELNETLNPILFFNKVLSVRRQKKQNFIPFDESNLESFELDYVVYQNGEKGKLTANQGEDNLMDNAITSSDSTEESDRK